METQPFRYQIIGQIFRRGMKPSLLVIKDWQTDEEFKVTAKLIFKDEAFLAQMRLKDIYALAEIYADDRAVEEKQLLQHAKKMHQDNNNNS